ncbi:MAG: cyclopropane fatty acyl phospholipid synthase [Candidatus Paceibacterota bacterium]|jgi:cyclopropane-fatty-acyl-phospholipid synthase
MAKNAKILAQEMILPAGININGREAWDICVHKEETFDRVFAQGSLGLGEAYMDGWWDCKRLDEFFYRVICHKLDKKFNFKWPLILQIITSFVLNQQAGKKAFEIGKKHYDIGNDLFQLMLGKTMAYSCGYWSSPIKPAKNLNEAQEAKFELICKKLGLKKGMEVLDIGCGWGTFMKYASKRYGVKSVGVTVSKEQTELAKKLCKGLPVEIKLQDYRKTHRQFDRIVSIGMIEHVGSKNYKNYMRTVDNCLKDDGLFLLHTIGSDETTTVTDPWVAKYIFPNSHLPSIKQIGEAAEKIFVMEDWQNLGADYDKTLMAWHKNFKRNWPKLEKKYGRKFFRMWEYYLLSCAGMFRARGAQLWQIVFSKKGVPGGWKPVR